MLDSERVAKIFATFFYIGKIKYCPGTFGSLAAFPLTYMIAHFAIINRIILPFTNLNHTEQELLSLFLLAIAAWLLLFIVGIYCSSAYIQYAMKDDPSEVVIDEVAGQMLVIILCFFSITLLHHSRINDYFSPSMIDFIFLFILPFSLFRFFDIVKPWPINWLDANIKGGIGIMLDDLLAAIFASVVHYIITFFIIDWLA